ncbi:cytochrome C550 [Achromatium sp. WMS2]|nr:cytochrome C550 [Achromatium sp. WMS2]
MQQLVYLNGEFIPKDQARISVMDRGFLFGDGVYEVLPAFGGKLFRLKEHVNRLNNSLNSIYITPPYSHTEWEDILTQLVKLQATTADSYIYLQITRGAAAVRDHVIPPQISPTIFAMANPIPTTNAANNARGIGAITRNDFRWERCDIKAITLLANVLLRQEAMEAGTTEAILIRDGQAVEGAASNLFIVRSGVMITPPTSNYLLPGITRDLILELAAVNNIPHKVEPIAAADLTQAEEIWMTSSVREIMPVIHLDGVRVGMGIPGPHWQHINKLYQSFKANVRLS